MHQSLATGREELTPVSFLERAALVYADRIAVVHEDRRHTYGELGARVNRLASALRRAGLEKGDRVAFICPNIPALLEAHFGVPAAGGVLVALNHRLSPGDIARILSHADARFVFVDHEFERLVAGAGDPVTVIRVDDTGEAGDPYEALLAAGSPEPVVSVLQDEREPISIHYSSWSTGRPTGTVASHRGAYLSALGEAVDARLTPESVHLWTLPMFHWNGWGFPWAVTAAGGRHVCLRKIDPARVWELIDEEGVTHYSAAPTVQAALLSHANAHRVAGGIVTAMSGSRPTRELFVRLTQLGIRPVHVDGATEVRDGWKHVPVAAATG
jgi:fatty-acyl-CoA synthase